MPTAAISPELVTAAQEGRGAVRALVRRLGGAPLQRDQETTFVYVGEADRVSLVHWMDVFEPLSPFRRQPGTDLWWLTVRLPDHARIEYRLRVERDGRTRTILDSLNPERAANPFGENSIVAGPGYQRPTWTYPIPDTPAGEIMPLEIGPGVWNEPRRVHLRLPAVLPEAGLPIVFAHDGSDYIRFAALGTVLDNLVAVDDIPPIGVALLDPRDRNREYTGDARHARHLVDEVLPAVEAAVSVTRRVVMGASLGAVASLHAAWQHPGVFDAAILQSGSFATGLGGRFGRGSVFKPVVRFLGEFHADPRPLPDRIYMSCGRFEGMLAENNTLAEALERRGALVRFEVTPDGHDWGNWRNRLRTALRSTVADDGAEQ